MTMVIAAFAIAAMHVGTADNPMTVTPMTVTPMTVTPMAMTPMASMAFGLDPMQPVLFAMSGGTTSSVNPHQHSDAMAMTMMCELIVMVAAAGYLLAHRLDPRTAREADLVPSRPVLERPRRGLRPARPPGLSMLCVAIC